jgi:CTP:molybdopterin cytidylyltransferase MocA/predicted DCC family thiol-disulfide oxidoreductase YuxK
VRPAAVWGVVLAAGRAHRFGHDKLQADLGGTTVLGRVLAAVGAARDGGALDGVVVVHRAGDLAVAQSARAMGWETVANPLPERGLSGSLGLGLEWLGRLPPPGPEWALVVLADQPLLRASVIATLVAAATGEADAVRPRYRGAPETPGHPVLIRRSSWPRITEPGGDEGFRVLLQHPDARVITIDVDGENPDIDRPGDLERVRTLLEGSATMRREGVTRIIFFDGYCGLCNRFVDFALRHDRDRRLRFSPLQGATAAELLQGINAADPATIVFLDEDGSVERSSAVLRIMGQLGGPWTLATFLLLIPRPVRDAVYDWVARHRFRWFGRKDSCRVPTPEERAFFLP